MNHSKYPKVEIISKKVLNKIMPILSAVTLMMSTLSATTLIKFQKKINFTKSKFV